jgi:predicted HicB family RNase H-like nuclease
MSTKVVRFEPELHARMKARAAVCQMTIKGWLKALIEVELKREPK